MGHGAGRAQVRVDYSSPLLPRSSLPPLPPLDRGVPVSSGLDLTNFLVDIGTIGDWNMEGLPTDPLSIQNGILVTRSSRYPLLIDPQGQALNWIKNHEADRMPSFGVTSHR